MRYYITRHQTKANYLMRALNACRHTFVNNNAEVALFDHELDRTGETNVRSLMREKYNEGSTVVLYPHGATGSWWMDGLDLDPIVSASLVIGEGHKRFMQIVKPEHRVEVIGWYYCPVLPFRAIRDVKRILFAPIHPSGGGRLRPEALQANQIVYETLLNTIGNRNLIIRHIGKLENSGLWRTKKPTFKLAIPNGDYSDIDAADLVIAEGTFMYMAVARGKPTIGINQHIPIRPNSPDPNPYKAKHWDEYKDFYPYPINFESDKIEELIDYASRNEQSEWKRLFIGEFLKPSNLSKALVSIRNDDVRVQSSHNTLVL